MMSSTLSKIHVTNSTGVSLNERFTAISTQPKVVNNIGTTRRSRSRSVQRVQMPAVAIDPVNSRANQRLLAQLQRKHKVQAALKLKRRSMRTVGGGSNGNGANNRIRRGSVKAFRVGANGKPIRTNSLTRIATMKADRESLNNRSRPLRRNNSSVNLASRLGPRRPTVGGAAQRVAKRNVDRQRRRNSGGPGGIISGRGRSAGLNNNNINRGRSRSRSRTRTLSDNGSNRSRTRNNNGNQLNNSNRSRSRNRNRNDLGNLQSPNNGRLGRSRSRSRGRAADIKPKLPIKARLGVRPGATANRAPNNRGRNASLTRRGVQTGRVQKRRNSTNANAAGNDNNGRGRIRSRSAARNVQNGNVRSRSRSRTRKGQVGQQRQQQQGAGQMRQPRNSRAPRGRIQQRRGNNNNNNSNSGHRGSNNNGKAQTQPRRGRSRSRTGRGGNNGVNRNQGNKTNAATKSAVNKDDLDKELDNYMATTKTENEMDYLLKN